MEPNEDFLTTEDGIRLFLQTVGDGPQKVVIANGIYLYDDFKHLADGRTLIFYDLRNRGRSDSVTDAAKLKRGIQNDVNDLEAVRRHFGIDKLDVIGHSYVGLMVILYAMKNGAHVDRIVQLGPMEPTHGKQYPAHLTAADDTLHDVFVKLAELQKETEGEDPVERCRKFWSVMRVIYVADPANADKVNWGHCELPNERNFMKYWSEDILPSIQSFCFAPKDFANVKIPVLTIHGRKDRSAPYGGAREWALLLPNARLVTVENAGHGPWIEAPELVFGSINTFLNGAWPKEAEKVESIEPRGEAAKV